MCPLLAWAMTKQLDGNTGFTDAECDDTIELELSPEEMLALSRADAAPRSNPLAVPPAEKSLPNVRKDPRDDTWPAVILPIAVVSVLSGGIAYLATTAAQPVHVDGNTVVRSAAPDTPARPSADDRKSV